MSLTQKTDVKNHLFARGRERNRPHIIPDQPDKANVSKAEPGEAKVDSSKFDSDFVGEHSPGGISIMPDTPLAGSIS
jgi:hypothetical protein